MTILSNPYSSPRCIDGSGWIHIWLGSYPSLTSGSAVLTIPLWLRPPEPPSAPIVSPLALWSRTGIGFILVLLAENTNLQGMARIFKWCYHFYMYIYCISLYLSLLLCACSAAMPLPDCDSLNHCCTSGSPM